MTTHRFVLGLLVLVLVVSAATPSFSDAPSDSASAAVQRKVVIATDPILDMFQWYSAEVQIRIAQVLTTGVGGSYLSLDDDKDQFTSGNAFLRYYPQGYALEGFSLGARMGIYYVKTEDQDEDAIIEEEDETTMYGFGIEIGYSWLLGAAKRVSISTGIGAVRLFGGDLEEDADEDVLKTLPTIRLVYVGYAF